MKIQFGNGPIRSLDRVIKIIISIIIFVSLIGITNYALDKETNYHDQVVQNYMSNSTKPGLYNK